MMLLQKVLRVWNPWWTKSLHLGWKMTVVFIQLIQEHQGVNQTPHDLWVHTAQLQQLVIMHHPSTIQDSPCLQLLLQVVVVQLLTIFHLCQVPQILPISQLLQTVQIIQLQVVVVLVQAMLNLQQIFQ